MSDDMPSVSRIAGQLDFLFEDRPELKHASAAELAARLDHEDRFARARDTYPAETDEFVTEHIGEFPARITASLVAQALAQLRASDD
jgi:hypothetical protein